MLRRNAFNLKEALYLKKEMKSSIKFLIEENKQVQEIVDESNR